MKNTKKKKPSVVLGFGFAIALMAGGIECIGADDALALGKHSLRYRMSPDDGRLQYRDRHSDWDPGWNSNTYELSKLSRMAWRIA